MSLEQVDSVLENFETEFRRKPEKAEEQSETVAAEQATTADDEASADVDTDTELAAHAEQENQQDELQPQHEDTSGNELKDE
jgi:hypothetical protein